jgi:hypothetical protein
MNKFPFIPPPELIEEWIEIAKPEPRPLVIDSDDLLSIAAELEAL